MLRFHQSLTDEERVISGRTQPCNVAAALNSTLGHCYYSMRQNVCDSKRCFQTHFEGPQVTAVDADQITSCIQRAA